MNAKNFKPGQVWKTRDGNLVGIEQIATEQEGGNFPVYGRQLTGENAGSQLNFSLEGTRSTAQFRTNPLDLMELHEDAPDGVKQAEFKSVAIGGDDMPEELKAMLAGVLSGILNRRKEKQAESDEGDSEPCPHCSRALADVLIVEAVRKGYLNEPGKDGASLMSDVQSIITARQKLDV